MPWMFPDSIEMAPCREPEFGYGWFTVTPNFVNFKLAEAGILDIQAPTSSDFMKSRLPEAWISRNPVFRRVWIQQKIFTKRT